MRPSLEQFTIGQATHHALVRGREGGPLLLLVQAGPGFPMISEADAIEEALGLEAQFRVIYWDQRGTGRSVEWSKEPLGPGDLVSDLDQLSRQLCERFAVSSVGVIGFSLGGSVAMLAAARPGSPIGRVIAVGPDIDLAESEAFAWRFAREEATRRGDRRALAELAAIGSPPHDTPERFMTRVKWVTNFGGIEVGASFLGLIVRQIGRLLRSRYYSLPQVIGALQSMQATQQRALKALHGFSLAALLPSIPVPLTLIQGQLDAAAPPLLAARFIEELQAPRGKRLIMLEDCAHSPHFEAPGPFRKALLMALREPAAAE